MKKWKLGLFLVILFLGCHSFWGVLSRNLEGKLYADAENSDEYGKIEIAVWNLEQEIKREERAVRILRDRFKKVRREKQKLKVAATQHENNSEKICKINNPYSGESKTKEYQRAKKIERQRIQRTTLSQVRFLLKRKSCIEETLRILNKERISNWSN